MTKYILWLRYDLIEERSETSETVQPKIPDFISILQVHRVCEHVANVSIMAVINFQQFDIYKPSNR